MDYNYIKASGKGNITDDEIIEIMGLDPKVKGTPMINKMALEVSLAKMEQEMTDDERYSEDEVKRMVSAQRDQVMKQIRSAEEIAGKKLI